MKVFRRRRRAAGSGPSHSAVCCFLWSLEVSFTQARTAAAPTHASASARHIASPPTASCRASVMAAVHKSPHAPPCCNARLVEHRA